MKKCRPLQNRLQTKIPVKDKSPLGIKRNVDNMKKYNLTKIKVFKKMIFILTATLLNILYLSITVCAEEIPAIGTLPEIVLKWIPAIGIATIAAGGIIFANSFADDNAAGKIKGLQVIIAGAILSSLGFDFTFPINSSSLNLGTLASSMVSFVVLTGGITAAIGGVQLAVGFTQDDVIGKTKGIQTIITGAILAAIGVLNITVSSSSEQFSLSGLTSTLKAGIPVIGGIMIAVGAIHFAVSFTQDSAVGKISGLQTLIAGAIIAVLGTFNINISTGNADFTINGLKNDITLWIKILGGVITAMGGIHLAAGFTQEDSLGKVKGLGTIVCGIILTAIGLDFPSPAVPQNTNAFTLNTIMNGIALLSGMIASGGGIQLGIGFTTDDDKNKIRGIQTIVTGGILFGISSISL